MAKIELIPCPTCNRTTLHVWQCDWLDAESDEEKEFYLVCECCKRICTDFDTKQLEMAKNAKLEGYSNGMA